MRVWIKIHQPVIDLDYRELAEKMWFHSFLGKELELSHEGNSEWLKDNYTLSLKWDKWDNDSRWASEENLKGTPDKHISLNLIKNIYLKTIK
ncbi:hypothetical protein [Enterococcus sp. LJL51]|uniref:hypothetical protein n=1 Tax=Enterococcus sp. LJL51 TaxID=3416656 RepID=UPI003CF719DB